MARAPPEYPGDPDFAPVRSRRREPIDALPIREIEARLARSKKARAG